MRNRGEITESMINFQDAGKNSVTENLRAGSEIIKKAGTLIPNPEVKAATQLAGSLMETGANAKAILDRKKAEKEAKAKEVANEVGKMVGAGLSGEKKTIA